MKGRRDAILRPEQAAYLDALEPARDPLLAEMESWARDHGHQPISDPEVASFLAVTARAARPRSVLEVGSNIGYGAIVLARAAGPDARVTTLEKNPDLCRVAREFVARAGLAARIDVREADSRVALAADDAPIDLAYVDCVKEDYPLYLDAIVPRLVPGGLLIADNVLWRGMVASPAPVPDADLARVEALRAFNRALVTDARLRAVVLPLGDGVAFATRV